MGNYHQGEYEIINKDKYTGNGNPRYLSSWELVVFKTFDLNPNVIEWGSENVIIPYYSSADGRKRRYMVDIYVKYKNRRGNIIKELIEIKPFAQTQPPIKKGRKKTQTYINELYTWQVNQDKWAAAMKYAKDRNMVFRVLTEKQIFR